MAKRKAAGTTRRKAALRRGSVNRKRAAGRMTASRKAAKRTAPKKAKKKSAGALRRSVRASARKPAARKAVARKAIARKATARKAVVRKAVASKAVARKGGIRKAPSVPRSARTVVTRKAPALERARRIVLGDDIVATPPSSLNLDRTASAARTGRRELRERIDEHTETGPALTAGDVDADWESAYSVGDEAPGGDNPTPDQDVVDDIGKAVGVQYEDNEELKGEAKITKRDKHRWELDPASSEDYDDR
jgi:hypothetical protein